MCIIAIYQHYQMFPYEYSQSTIQAMLKDYTPFIIMGLLILGLLVNVLWAFGINTPSIKNAMPDIPAVLSTPVPNISLGGANNKGGGLMNAIGMGGNSSNKVANAGIGATVMNAIGMGGRAPNNTSHGGIGAGVMNALGMGGNQRPGNNKNRYTTI